MSLLKALRIITLIIAFIAVNLYLTICFVLKPRHKNNVQLGGLWYSKLASLLGIKLVIRKSTAINDNDQYVFVANHQNSYDLITISRAAQPGVVTIGKKSLIFIPVFGFVYWLSGNIMINRKDSNAAKGTLEYAARQMRERGLSLWFFAEGTRSYGRGLLPFKTGAFRIAQNTNTPLVPICMSETHNKIDLSRWDNGVLIIELFDPVMPPEDQSSREWAEQTHSMMKAEIERLTAEADLLSGRNTCANQTLADESRQLNQKEPTS